MKIEKDLALEGLRGIASLNVVSVFLFSFFPYLAHHFSSLPKSRLKLFL